MRGLRIFSILLLPACAGFALLLALSAAATPGPFVIPWEAVAVVFGATVGYAVVLTRRPRRIRGGTLFLVAAAGCLAAATWVHSVVVDTGRPLLLFVAAGTNLAGTLLADDALGGALRRGSPWLETHPWSAAGAVGVLFGLVVGGLDVAWGDHPLSALLRGAAWAAVGALLHRFTVVVAAPTPRRPSRSADPDNVRREVGQ